MNRLAEKKREGLVECSYKINQYKKFKSDFDALEERLSSLTYKLSYDIMVPFGPKAFMPGTMVHTNNITVLLGDNWFTEMSAKQAVDYVKRRKLYCEEMLRDLEEEQKQYQKWFETSKLFAKEEVLEIIEPCNEEELAHWREQHRKSEIAHKQKEAQERKDISKFVNHIESSNMNGIQAEDKEDAYFDRLNHLMMEECPKEINNSNSGTEDDLSNESEDDDFETESMNTDSAVEASPEGSPHQNSNEFNENDMSNENERHNKHVRWIDISEAKSKCINFTHSKFPPTQHYYKKRNKRKRRNSSTSDFDEEEPEEKNENGSPAINSPSDIYKYFNLALQQSKPRSILKSNSTETKDSPHVIQNLKIDNNDYEHSTMEYENSEKYINTFLARKMGENLAFTGEITEHSINTMEEQSIPVERPKSLFRSFRENARQR